MGITKRAVSGVVLTLLLTSMLTFMSSIAPVSASGTIYIRADGSVDPPSAPIQNVGNTYYTFTADINDSIVVERDSIVLDGAGHTLQGSSTTWGPPGIDLDNRSYVTIKNMKIREFPCGIHLDGEYTSTNHNSFSGNNITNNGMSIDIEYSDYNSVFGNNITDNTYGIILGKSLHNSVSGNNITNNTVYGISLGYSDENSVSGNNIADNHYQGIVLKSSSSNGVSGNNITSNDQGGIWLFFEYYLSLSSNNTISGNNITNNGGFGIMLRQSPNNVLRSNSMADNEWNFDVEGANVSDFANDVDTSNTVNGKPTYYWINKQDKAVPLDAGYVALVNCTNITVENLDLKKNGQNILLVNTNKSTITRNTVIDGYYHSIELYVSSSNGVSGNNITSPWGNGIYLYNSSYNSVSGNNITNNYYNGICLDSSSNSNTISGNNITNSSNGVGLFSFSNNNTISGNNLTNNSDGVYLYSSNYNGVSRNYLANNDNGVSLSSANCTSVSGNNITNNSDGVYLFSAFYSSVSGNNITHNDVHGIVLDSSLYNSISGNNLTTSNTGVYLYSSLYPSLYNIISANNITNNDGGILFGSYSDNNTISGNNIAHNYYGIYLYYASKNRIYHNNFINNTDQVYNSYSYYNVTNVWDDGYPSGGNYWSDYTGVDLYSGPSQNQPGSDGIGDTPYVIDANNKDRYPLMSPWTPPPPSTCTLTVHAQKTLGGKPIQGVNVTVNEDSTLIGSALTDENGNAVFQVSAGTYTIVAKRHLFGPKYITKEQTVEISKDTTVTFTFVF
jgi:parallel beta-helix repeat protein